MSSTAVLSQAPVNVKLLWHEGDPVSLNVTATADWSGTYTATLTQDATEVPVIVTAVLIEDQTLFTFSLDDSSAVTAGQWDFACKQTDGPTRFAGKAYVS